MALFSQLQLWRLPPRRLLDPWLPGQVVMAGVAAQFVQLEAKRDALAEEGQFVASEVARLHELAGTLEERLERAGGASTLCMQRQADVNEAIKGL